MSQEDIRRHYEEAWKQTSSDAADTAALSYSSPVEDAVLYPIYEKLIADLSLRASGGRVLDVGSGSGRWIRFFLERFKPARLVGTDFTQASVDLLMRWHAPMIAENLAAFLTADITAENLNLGETFDLINIANVLFHIPEPDRFARALINLAAHLAEGGRVITTEYLPRTSMRTEWMLVRSRYDFERAVDAAGMKIVDIRACSFFSNDPMGVDGPDDKTRRHFQQVRSMMAGIARSNLDAGSKQFFTNLSAEIERACLAFCGERIAPVDMPAQKLVVLGKK